MATRDGTFYSPWPVLDGKDLNLQWGEIRSNQAELKAIARSSHQELEDGVDELNAQRALLGMNFGDIDFDNEYRVVYKQDTREFCLQKNDGTEDVPVWTDVWCIRRHDGQFQVVSNGGIVSSAGFYNFPKKIELVADSHSLGTVDSDDVSINCPDRILFDADSGLKVRQVDCGAHKGAPEVTFTAPFGRAQVFNASGEEWTIEHNFNTSPVMVQVMDSDDRVFTPDKADVSDPNTAYFYFHANVVGKVIIATGGTGVASIQPRDPFYLVVRTDDQSAATRTLRPNADLRFDKDFFYVEAHEDIPDCRARPWARVSLLPEIFYINNLKDVTVTHPITTGHVLTWEPAESAFVPKEPKAGALYINDLKDVVAPNPADGDVLIYDKTTGDWLPQAGVKSSFIHTQTSPSVEWVVSHTQGSELVLAQVFDEADRQIFPDEFDVSDPNVAYFYFSEEVSGKAFIIATGATSTVDDHGGLTGLMDDDHTQYLLIDGTRAMIGDFSTGGNNISTGSGDINLTSGSITTSSGNITASAGVVAGTRARVGDGSETNPAYHFINDSDVGIYRVAEDTLGFSAGGVERAVVGRDGVRVNDKVEAEAFYLGNSNISEGTSELLIHTPGRLRVDSHVRLDDTLNVENAVTAEAFYLTTGGEITSGGIDVTDGFNVYESASELNFEKQKFYLTSDLDGNPVINLKVPTRLTPVITSGVASTAPDGAASIPPWVNQITVVVNGVSADAGSTIYIQIGPNSGFVTSGYNSRAENQQDGSQVVAAKTVGFPLTAGNTAAEACIGVGTITRMNSAGTTWVFSYGGHLDGSNNVVSAAGSITLSAPLDRVRILTDTGNFDGGEFTIHYM